MEFTLARHRSDTFPEHRLFAEMERIWRLLGHRPSRTEWEASDSTIHYNTYRRRFGGWTNACIKFIEHKMGAPIADIAEIQSSSSEREPAIPDEKKRQLPLRLRLKVLERDNYSCVLCGKSPALIQGTVLHIDHRVPFARGGKTMLDNLQTLCAECNLGKGAFDFPREG